MRASRSTTSLARCWLRCAVAVGAVGSVLTFAGLSGCDRPPARQPAAQSTHPEATLDLEATPQQSELEPKARELEHAPLQEETGWTTLKQHPNAQTYFVSSSTGSDKNAGTDSHHPYATVKRALSQLNQGDWVLLKRGDVFRESIDRWANGTSEEHYSVIGAYGSLEKPRPIVDPEGKTGLLIKGGGGAKPTVEYLAIVGIHFKQSMNVPGTPKFSGVPVGGGGITILRPGHDVLIEDVMLESFMGNINLQGEQEPLQNVTLRRSVIVDAYNLASKGHSQGLFAHKVQSLLMEENVFDHNGWHEKVPGAQRTKFNHNIYVQRTCTNPILKNNIIARASANGFQLRPHGVAAGNVVLANPIGGYVSNNNLGPNFTVELRGNVALHGAVEPVSESVLGWGIFLNATGPAVPQTPILFEDNIIAHAEAGAWKAESIPKTYEGLVTPKNVIYNWGKSESTPGRFADPERTIPSYQRSIGEPESIDAFLVGARAQRRGAWDHRYTAQVVVAYFRQGFSPAESAAP